MGQVRLALGLALRGEGAQAGMGVGAGAATLTPVLTCAPSPPAPAIHRSVYGRVGSSGKFNILASSIAKCGLDKELMGEGPFTIFAPGEPPWGCRCCLSCRSSARQPRPLRR